jgi:hypothetical protein
MEAEASTIMRAVVTDFFFKCWYLEIPSDNRIRHISRCVHYHAQGFGSEMAVRLSALRTSRTLLPRNILIFMFLVLISVRG